MNHLNLKYDAYMFDCDGVILDANRIKSDCFYDLALKYGADIAQEFVDYHKEFGGISRFVKIAHLHNEILKDGNQQRIDEDIQLYSKLVLDAILKAPPTIGFLDFIKLTQNNHVVSGGKEEEIQEIFEKQNIADHFITINGSPRSKFEIVDSIQKKHNYKNVLFIGDSKLDYDVAEKYSFDFAFISDYTEFYEWKDFFVGKNVFTFDNFAELVKQY